MSCALDSKFARFLWHTFETSPLKFVTERCILLHEKKMIERGNMIMSGGAALSSTPAIKKQRCYFCHKFGHIQKHCVEHNNILAEKKKGETCLRKGIQGQEETYNWIVSDS